MRDHRSQFVALFCFLVGMTLLLTNGFVGRIFAQGKEADVYSTIEPMADVLDEIMQNYVEDPKVDKVVEGALIGMMNALDDHSSYMSPDVFEEMVKDTKGEFEGIGVSIRLDEDRNIAIEQTLPGSPALEKGVMAGDVILKIDGTSTKGMGLDDAKHKIRGARGTMVHLTLFRRSDQKDKGSQIIELDIRRDKIALESVSEARVLSGGVGYIRLIDFKENTANEVAKRIKELEEKGMKSLVLDLRWNPGGLMTASRDLCELFLPRNTLVTYTRGRNATESGAADTSRLYTQKEPLVPASFPIVLLVNDSTASSSEIVTGALQYWTRAIVVGEKTYGKGSVQTIIQLRKPANSALRLTTALYYTPAEVTINKHGILPDVDAPMSKEDKFKLFMQMRRSQSSDPAKKDQQNHGSVSGDPVSDTTTEDTQLQKAVDIILEDGVFENLVKKYHKDTHVTQVAASDAKETKDPQPKESVEVLPVEVAP